MAAGVDYQGIALVISAVGIAVPSILTAVVSLISLRRGKARDAVAADNTVALATIQKHVNGMNKLIAAGAHAEGVIEGADAERANPTQLKSP